MARSTARAARDGLQLFASAPDEQRSRRPTDVALLIVGVLVLLAAGTMYELASGFESSLRDAVMALPGLLEPLWRLAFWGPVAWAGALLATSVVRRRWSMTRDVILVLVVGTVIALVTAAIMTEGDRSLVDVLANDGAPPAFPVGALAIAVAVTAAASPHLTRPFRYFGRWMTVAQLLAAIALGAAVPSGAIAAIAIGLIAAATIHVTFGSPGGRPTESRIRLALADLGIVVRTLQPATMQPAGVVLFDGEDADGPLQVKVFGRDAWDAQLLTNLWRLLWYRGADRTIRLSRIDLVEHEAFINLLADRAGVRVSRLVTAGSAGLGDALIVVRPCGAALDAAEATPSAALPPAFDPSSLWHALDRLHRAGIVHRRIDLDRVLVDEIGAIAFGDLSSASVAVRPGDVLQDRAQAFVLSYIATDEATAVDAATAALGDGFADIVPYLQDAAMAPGVRDALARRDIDLDRVRRTLGDDLGLPERPLIKLRRVTVGSLVNLALLAFAAYALIALLGGLDLETFADELADASWWWLGFALVLAQIPRIPAAVSTMGSTQYALPLGPLTALQFAICYINLAIPSTAARVAINIRFLQRFGVPPTAAVSAGVIDSVSGFIVQAVLFVSLFAASDADLELSTDAHDLSGLATFALIVIGVIVVAILVVAFVRPVRRRFVAAVREAWESLQVLRSPSKLLQLFGGNVLAQVLFAVSLGAAVRAFGYDVALSELVLINTVVSLFAGLLPIPGGIGVAEGGLTLGLTRAGLPAEVAFAAALAYRFASFYLPPIWGWFCYRGLVRRRYL